MRRLILCFLVSISLGAGAEGTLPTGSGPAPIDLPHFPSRLHALVWRNWNLVKTEQLARVVGASAEQIREIANEMGLPAQRPVPLEYRARLYLSIIRRNWQLLPYEQMLTLLNMSSEQLAQTLREDDFLWIKLGALKPKCAPITYVAPTAAARARSARIATLLRENFADDPAATAQPPLGFLKPLSQPIPDSAVRPSKGDATHPRFLYSYFAVFGDPLSDPSLDPYPDALLQRYADLGVNGVWLHVVLRDLAPAGFPGFGEGHERRIANLAKLVARAKRFHIGVYLYMNEPRAMPTAWFDGDRKNLAGVSEGGYTALCTSQPAVRKWLADSLNYVFTQVPDIAGVFTITASENLTNCASHHHSDACPRCRNRRPADIIAEVNATIEEGVHRAAPHANVIAWDWGWPDAIAPDIIAKLPKSVYLMSVSEWSLPLDRGGVKTTVGEYSISAVGPGPRATRHWHLAKARGLKTIAKVQANNTWELSAVPYLPTLDLIAQHATRLAGADVDGLMLSWSLGGFPSPNLELFQRVLEKQDAAAVLDELGEREFGPLGAAHARKAWTLFSRAFEAFPYSGTVNYNAPLQLGPANLLFAKPTGYHASMVGFPYDDLTSWRGPYPEAVFEGQLEKLTTAWAAGLKELEVAVESAPAEKAPSARMELGLAQAAYLHFASVLDQSRFVRVRNRLAVPGVAAGDRANLQAELRRILHAEANRARELYRFQQQDSRIGFEASNHYYYLPQDLEEKFLNCQDLLQLMN